MLSNIFIFSRAPHSSAVEKIRKSVNISSVEDIFFKNMVLLIGRIWDNMNSFSRWNLIRFLNKNLKKKSFEK